MMNLITEGQLQQMCLSIKPKIDDIRRENLESQIEIVEPIRDARSAVLIELLKLLYAKLSLEPPRWLKPVAGRTREGTIKTAILQFLDSHSDPYFDANPTIHKLLESLEVGSM